MGVLGSFARESQAAPLPTAPVTGLERERAGLKRFTTGFVPGLWNLVRDVGRLTPGGEEPEMLKQLFGTGARKSALLESYKNTLQDIGELRYLAPGGRKPSEMEIAQRAKESSWTEALLEDVLNVASVLPVVGWAAKGVGVGAKAAQMGGVASKAGQVAKAAQIGSTPFRSAAAGTLRAAGKPGAAQAVQAPVRAARAALEARALAPPATDLLPKSAQALGRASGGRQMRQYLIEAQRGLGRSQVEATRLESTAAMRTAATRMADLAKEAGNPISHDDAAAMVARHMQERLTGQGELGNYLGETLQGLGVKPRENPVVMPKDKDLNKLLDTAEGAYRQEQLARQIEHGVVPDMGRISAQADTLGARAAKNFDEYERVQKKIDKLYGKVLPRAVEDLARLGVPSEAGAIARTILESPEGVTPEVIRELSTKARQAPPRGAEGLLAKARAAAERADEIQAEGEMRRAVVGVEAAQRPMEQLAGLRGAPAMLPVMRQTVRDLREQLDQVIAQKVEEQLLPRLGEELTPKQLWGRKGAQLMRWAREGALETPEAQAIMRQIDDIQGNIDQLSGALERGQVQRGRTIGTQEERLRGIAREAETPTFAEREAVGRLTERERQLIALSERPTYGMGRATEKAVGGVRGTVRQIEKLQRRAASRWAKGEELARRALAEAEDIEGAPITAFPRTWRPMVQDIKSLRADIRKMVEEGTLDKATAAQVLDQVPENLTALMKLAADRGIDPAFVREFSTAEAKALATGAPRLGRGPYAPPGRKTTAGVRKASQGVRRRAGTMAENIEAFQAAKVELDHERIINQVADHTERTFARPIPADRVVPKGWVPWSPTRPFGEIERLTETPSGLTLTKTAAPGAELMVPEAVANQLKKFSQAMPQSSLLGAAEKVMRPWRTMLLTMSPRWYINNVLGNVLLATVEGVSPIDWVRAWQALRFEERGGQKMRGLNVPSRVKGLQGLPEELPAELVAGGVRHEYTEPNRLTRGIQDYVRRKTGGKISNVSITRMNSVVDEFARTAVYMRAFRRGATPEQALQRGVKALVDYGDMSPLERDIMRKIIPFYAWQKGILKLTLKLPLDHPYRIAVLSKVGQMFGGYTEEERQRIPEYMFGDVESPWGPEGSRLSLRGANPFADAFSLATADGILSSLSPLIEVPGRALFNVPEKGYFAEEMEVGPIGFARPNITMAQQLLPWEEGGIFREMPQVRALTTPGAATQLFGATIRSPEQIRKARERLAKGRAMAASSLLPEQPEGAERKRRTGVLARR